MRSSAPYQWLPKLVLILTLATGPVFASASTETIQPAVSTSQAKLNPATPPADVEVAPKPISQPETDSIPLVSEQPDAPEQPLFSQIESLKKQLIKLNRDLFILEEELLFPASTQVSVLLAVDADQTFKLDSIKLKIDNKVVTQYLYTNRQISALQRGGVQRLYMGNLRAGEHELTAVFIGYGPNQREYKRAATLKFQKETGQKTIEVKISASEGNYQPEFSVIES